MDIKQAIGAVACVTLGKDMTFRDYAQGTFRMRGIGIGQTLRLLIIPEVLQLIEESVAMGEGKSVAQRAAALRALHDAGRAEDATRRMLRDVAAWLVLNQMRSEKIQFNLLSQQNLHNTN